MAEWSKTGDGQQDRVVVPYGSGTKEVTRSADNPDHSTIQYRDYKGNDTGKYEGVKSSWESLDQSSAFKRR